jgi:cell division protein FtsQ
MAKMFKLKIRKEVRWGLLGLSLFVILGFSGSYYHNQICQKLHIQIDYNGGNFFLDEQDIQSLLDSNSREFLLNTPYKFINTKQLEGRVMANPFVEHCSISKKLNGELAVFVQLVKPIVRVLGEQESFYLDKDGKKIPLSKKYTPHCLVLSLDNVYFDFKKKESDKKLLALLNFITSSQALSSQIAQIDKQKENLSMYLLLSNAEIIFGDLNNWEDKMKKLEILYRHILPKKGWNTYEKITLKYHQQVVCEYAKR